LPTGCKNDERDADMEQYQAAVWPIRAYWNDFERAIGNVAHTEHNCLRAREEHGGESEQYKVARENHASTLQDLARSLELVHAAGLRLPPVERRYLDEMRALGLTVPAATPVLDGEAADAG
jgi:hypothetical protein